MPLKLPNVVLPQNWLCDKHADAAFMRGVDVQSWCDEVFEAAIAAPAFIDMVMVYEGHGSHGYHAMNDTLAVLSPLCCMLGNEIMTTITTKHTRKENLS